MRLTHDLDLESNAREVQTARRWIVAACQKIGRAELAEGAELGLTELVTNAMLHGQGPVRVSLRGTLAHPRIEVRDHSTTPPEFIPDDSSLSTVGRGLAIVSMLASSWGAEIGEAGKVVWFEPAIEPDGEVTAPIIHRLRGSPPQPAPPPPDGLEVELLDFPFRVFANYLHHFLEVRRELRLLAISHGSDYPLAAEVTSVFDTFEVFYAAASGTEVMESPPTDRTRGTITVVVPPEAPEVLGHLGRLLDLADEFAANERLLSLASTPQQVAFRRWLFNQVDLQHAGRPARPWTGGFSVVDALTSPQQA